jgi:hypothetical protein
MEQRGGIRKGQLTTVPDFMRSTQVSRAKRTSTSDTLAELFVGKAGNRRAQSVAKKKLHHETSTQTTPDSSSVSINQLLATQADAEYAEMESAVLRQEVLVLEERLVEVEDETEQHITGKRKLQCALETAETSLRRTKRKVFDEKRRASGLQKMISELEQTHAVNTSVIASSLVVVGDLRENVGTLQDEVMHLREELWQRTRDLCDERTLNLRECFNNVLSGALTIAQTSDDHTQVQSMHETWACPVCLDSVTTNLCASVACGHVFHRACAQRALAATLYRCPVCREPCSFDRCVRIYM